MLALVFSVIAVVVVVIATVSGRGKSPDGIRGIFLTFPDGTECTFSPDDRGDEALLLSNLLAGSRESESVSKEHSVPVYRVSYRYDDRTDTYELFALKAESGYNVYLCSDDGTQLQATEASGKAFLSSTLGEDAFGSANLPVLYTSAEDTVIPSSAEWYFEESSRSFRKKDRIVIDASGETTYYQNGYVGFRFSKVPDSARIVISDRDKILFDGSPDELATSDLTYSGQLRVRISADWIKREDAGYYGHIEYDFLLQYIAPAVFTPSASTAAQGGFLLIRCENILDADRIRSQMLDDASLIIRFFRYGTDTYGVITVASDTTPGNKTVRCSYGGVTTDITFAVTENTYTPETTTYSVTRDKLSLGSGSARQAFISKYRSVCDQDPGYLFLSDSFVPAFGDGTQTIRFGDTVVPDGAVESYTAWFSEYLLPVGSTVSAMNGGVVCDTGYDRFFGNYVVIGHGSGVQTWYGHLSATFVQKGDILSRGDLIGVSGNSGFAAGNSLVLAVSVCGRLVDPTLLFDQIQSMAPQLGFTYYRTKESFR